MMTKIKPCLLLTFLLFFFLTPGQSSGQAPLTPGRNAFEKSWIKNETSSMAYYAYRDTTRMEVGRVETEVKRFDRTVLVITRVSLKGAKEPWIDTTTALLSTLAPVYHSSTNGQRDMFLHFGLGVTGFYHNKRSGEQARLSDTTKGAYFDSNLYPFLIRWLPLKEGYKKEIFIYDYNPSGRKGVMKAFVQKVTSGTLETQRSGPRKVWVVTVRDEISGDVRDTSTYYIDKKDRRLWRQDIKSGQQQMRLQLVE